MWVECVFTAFAKSIPSVRKNARSNNPLHGKSVHTALFDINIYEKKLLSYTYVQCILWVCLYVWVLILKNGKQVENLYVFQMENEHNIRIHFVYMHMLRNVILKNSFWNSIVDEQQPFCKVNENQFSSVEFAQFASL